MTDDEQQPSFSPKPIYTSPHGTTCGVDDFGIHLDNPHDPYQCDDCMDDVFRIYESIKDLLPPLDSVRLTRDNAE